MFTLKFCCLDLTQLFLMNGRKTSWQHHSPAITQITLSSVKLCLSLSELACFHALWNEPLLQSLHVFYASKKCILLKMHFQGFILSGIILYFYDCYFISSLNQIDVLH
jgi:hypothetical protein